MMEKWLHLFQKDKKFSNKSSGPNGEWPQNVSSKAMKANKFFTFVSIKTVNKRPAWFANNAFTPIMRSTVLSVWL